MLYIEIIAVCSEIHIKHVAWIIFKDCHQLVPRSKHSSVINTNQLVLYREIIAVCSEIHTQHINILCGQNVEFLPMIILGGILSICIAFKGLISSQLKPFTPR
jgi:hypothetical protein